MKGVGAKSTSALAAGICMTFSRWANKLQRLRLKSTPPCKDGGQNLSICVTISPVYFMLVLWPGEEIGVFN